MPLDCLTGADSIVNSKKIAENRRHLHGAHDRHQRAFPEATEPDGDHPSLVSIASRLEKISKSRKEADKLSCLCMAATVGLVGGSF